MSGLTRNKSLPGGYLALERRGCPPPNHHQIVSSKSPQNCHPERRLSRFYARAEAPRRSRRARPERSRRNLPPSRRPWAFSPMKTLSHALDGIPINRKIAVTRRPVDRRPPQLNRAGLRPGEALRVATMKICPTSTPKMLPRGSLFHWSRGLSLRDETAVQARR